MKVILKNTWAVLDKKEKKRFRLLIILDALISIIDILSLAALLWIIQFYIQPGNRNNLPFLPGWLTDKNSIWLIALFFILFGLKNLAAYFISRAHFIFIGHVAIRISRNNLLNYQEAGFEEFINTDSASHIRKIGFQPFEFCQYMLTGVQQVITQSLLIMLTIIAIILFNPKLFLLLLLILLPPVFAVFYFMKKRLTKAKKHIQLTNERSFQYLLDALKGYVESNIYDRNDFFLRRFIHSRRKFSAALFESLSLQNMPSRIIEVFAVLGLFVLVALAKWSGNNDSSQLITIGAFMAAAYKIIPGIVKIINVTSQMRAYEFSVTDIVPHTEMGKSHPGEKLRPDGIHSIQLKDISFQYPTQHVLDHLDLTITKGDFVGISGKSGKGKTTILNLLLGFLTPGQGQISVNGRPVNPEEIKYYWPFISYVRQQPFFIHDTIIKNITLEEEEYNKKNLEYALEVSGLNEFITKLPQGAGQVIMENGKNISGGQQQRITIARALYKNADLVLLDEPFNELDEVSAISLLEHFRELSSAGKIVIMITHDKKSLSYCNKIISLDEQE
ncbi:MAG: ABC transporter ATP-binding protein [Bacteroidota bacterium]|nr:ABC transporter ATP-binding protein [Bacteroidota bacterium]